MLDRAPAKPNRYAVYDDDHNFIRYEYHERADEPTQVGDALNKANLLPDEVATALGLTGNPQVKDALAKLETIASLAQTTANGRAKIAIGSYTGTGTFGSSNPNSLTFPFVPHGLLTVSHATNSNGEASALIWVEDIPTSFYRLAGASFVFQNDVITAYRLHVKKSSDGKTIYWYGESGMERQLNYSNLPYKYCVQG